MGAVVGFEVEPLPMTEGERIRALVKQIQTPAQFDAIVAQAAPELQESVRAMLEPLLTFDPETGEPRIHE